MAHTLIQPAQISPAGATTGNVLTYNGTVWEPDTAAGGGTVTGTGTTGRVTQWNDGAGGVLENSTLIKSGAGILTLSNSADYTLTINATSAISGTNTGDQDLSGYVPATRTVNSHALSADVTVTKGDVGLGNVENTALSTWAGSTSLVTLGTIGTGTWNGSIVGSTYGGTGINNGGRTLTLDASIELDQTGAVSGDVLFYNGTKWVPTSALTTMVVQDGSVTSGRMAVWVNDYHLQNSILALSGSNVLTLTASATATLTVPTTGTAALGAGTLTAATSNDVTVASHTHAITSSSNPGAAASLLATDSSGNLKITGTFEGDGLAAFGTTPTAHQGLNVLITDANSGSNVWGLISVATVNGTTTGARGVFGRADTTNASFTLADASSLFAANPIKGAASTITTAYGLQIASITTGATNYAIFTGTGVTHLGGGLRVGADGSGAASTTGFTNATNTTVTNTYIVRGGQAANTVNTGWIKIYIGTNAAWIPYWQNATP